jgi:hypothetical protein
VIPERPSPLHKPFSRSWHIEFGDVTLDSSSQTPIEEITRFLDILESRIRLLSQAMTEMASTLPKNRPEGGHVRFSDYMRSRDLTSECWAFSIVIERRIEDLPDSERPRLQQRFSRLTVLIWSCLLNCSLQFLDSLSREENLPLGSREIFVREIKTLYDANKWLSDDRYVELINDAMHNRQRQAEKILSTIIDRAPTLLELG